MKDAGGSKGENEEEENEGKATRNRRGGKRTFFAGGIEIEGFGEVVHF